MRKLSLVVSLLAGTIGLASGGSAEEGETWNSDHMQTRYRSVLSAESRAPEVSGENRYAAPTAKPTPQYVSEGYLQTDPGRVWGPERSTRGGSREPSWAVNHKVTSTSSSEDGLQVGGTRRSGPEGARPGAGSSKLRRRASSRAR